MDDTTKYICSGTQKEFMGKPWISIQSNRWDDVNGPVTFSSYLEYKANLDKLPVKHYDLIINKEDFNEPRPVIVTHKKPSTFNFLTETEINELTHEQFLKYRDELGEQFLLNPVRSSIYEESMLNDAYTQSIEDEYDSYESSEMDDY
mgnify:CR=1 FL=1|jgi:hypothetical protein|tara:strand:- start:180 stop:620 length:441 start_codon:yes stop_codon:yes gene_type:complete